MEKVIYQGMTLAQIIEKAKAGTLLKPEKAKKKRQTVQQYLRVPDTWPVKENIKHELVIMPTQQDVTGAKKGEPMACALHNAACRMFEIPNCAIGGRSAYIPQRGANGKMYIARMQATKPTQRAIRHFDKTGELPIAGFHFIPIPKSDHLKEKRTYMKEWEAGAVKTKRKSRKQPKHHKVYRSIPKSFVTGAK
jgi:hypothetical protein